MWNDSLPANWITCGQNVSKNMSTESLSADAYSGVKALQCKNVKIVNTATTYYIMPGWIEQKSVATSGVPICLSGAYKIHNNTNDTLYAILTLKTGSNVIGMASFSATGNAANYTSFCVTPTISGQTAADNFDVYVGFNKKNLHPSGSVNTYFLIDALEVNRLTEVPEINKRERFKVISNSNEFVVSAIDGTPEKFSVRLLTTEGKVIFSITNIDLPNRINSESLSQGLYVLQVLSDQGVLSTFKVIK
jgi:hypothetical protein